MLLLRAVVVAVIVPWLWLAMYVLTVGVPLNAPPAPWRQAILRPMLRFWADVLMWLGFGFWGWRVKGASHTVLLHHDVLRSINLPFAERLGWRAGARAP